MKPLKPKLQLNTCKGKYADYVDCSFVNYTYERMIEKSDLVWEKEEHIIPINFSHNVV
jgi:hypothetical protein